MRHLLLALSSLLLAVPALAEPRFIDRPDPKLTPGALSSDAVQAVCVSGYSKAHRHTGAALKREVLAAYGISWEDRQAFELDHLVPLCMGGADTAANLWPESRSTQGDGDGWTASDKDRLEDCICRLVCSGRVTQYSAFLLISGDWTKAYEVYIPMCHHGRRQ